MANWASNWVVFTGDKEKIDSLKKIINNMTDRANETGMGVLPLFQEQCFDNYFFVPQITDEDDEEVIITYETKWSGNFRDCAYLCEKLEINCEGTSEEEGNDYYEKFVYKDGKKGKVILQDSDINLHKYYINGDIDILDKENRVGPIINLTQDKIDELENSEKPEWYTAIDYEELESFVSELEVELE